MKIGIFTSVTDETVPPTLLGQAVEDCGFESLFIADHSHVPVKRETPYPYTADGVLGRGNYRVLDPFVSLAAIAAVTTRIRLGTGVALVAQRDPIMLAKEVATLDVISGGRVELGVGSGWLREEMRNHGTDPRTRVAVLGERIRAMKVIWSEDEAEFHGEFVDFDPIFMWPKPVQEPYPPVLIGGWGPSTFQRVVEYGEGWMTPVGLPIDRLRQGIEELTRVAEKHGRTDVTVTATILAGDDFNVEDYVELGIDRLLLLARKTDHGGLVSELQELSGRAGLP